MRDRDRVYGDCLPKSPQPATVSCVAVTYTRSTGVAPNTNMKNVWFGALCRGTEHDIRGQGWVGPGGAGGEEGLLTARERHMQAVRLAGDGPPMPKAPRQYL